MNDNPLLPNYTERDYPEDAKFENGNYINYCELCEEQFRGHKHRFICRVCREKGREGK